MPQVDLNRYGLHNPAGVVRAPDIADPTSGGGPTPEGELDFDRWARDTTAGVGRLVATAEAGELDALEGAIEALEALEEELRKPFEQLRELRDLAGRIRGQARHAPSFIRGKVLADARRLTDTADRLLGPLKSVLRSYRDGRWQLMALQAEEESPGDAPVFEDAESLIAHLES